MGNCFDADSLYTGTHDHAIRPYGIEWQARTTRLGVGQVVFSAGADCLGLVAYEGLDEVS